MNALWDHSASYLLLQDADQSLLWCWFAVPSPQSLGADGGCRVTITSLCLRTAELGDNLSARIDKACPLAIFFKGRFAVRHFYQWIADPW